RLLLNTIYDRDIVPRFSWSTLAHLAQQLKDPDFVARADAWTQQDSRDFKEYATSLGKASDIHKTLQHMQKQGQQKQEGKQGQGQAPFAGMGAAASTPDRDSNSGNTGDREADREVDREGEGDREGEIDWTSFGAPTHTPDPDQYPTPDPTPDPYPTPNPNPDSDPDPTPDTRIHTVTPGPILHVYQEND
ncbi:hypothetical protein B484DRAFT_391941, partial [Ochromonadaceae sp. CCMP2298]